MNQNVWGPHLWFSLHTISFTYPLKPKDSDRANYKSFFTELQHVIPCSVCKKNYIRHLKEFPVNEHLNSRKDIVYWVIDLHNMVNSETGKRVLTYDEALKRYEDVYKKKILITQEDVNKSGCKNDTCDDDSDKFIIPNYVTYILLIFILLFLIYIFHKKYKIKIIAK
jgi:hypothetical protein